MYNQDLCLQTSYVDPVCLYVPVIDHAADKPFLPDYPSKLQPAKVPVLFGINSADGLLKTGCKFSVVSSSYDMSAVLFHS